MTRVLYPGSFDPIHLGHVEIIETASQLFDETIVAATVNPQKGSGLFDLDVREQVIKEVCAHLGNVSVTMFSGLVVDLAKQVRADFILKGPQSRVGLRERTANGADEPGPVGNPHGVRAIGQPAIVLGLEAHSRGCASRR